MPIEVTGLYHSYKQGTPFEQEVLSDINLTIEDGEFVGIIGPTRSGKSTLAQHFNALFIPRRGKIFINEYDTTDKNADLVRLRHMVGYVFQNPDYQLFAPTVGEDIAFGPKKQKLAPDEVEQRVEAAMAQVGLDYETFYKRDIYALSGGQKRRAAIAGVLACKPKILVLDDVTAGLDPRGREEILSVVTTLHRERQITILFISTSMDEAALLADRILVMDRGKIIIDDATRKVLSRTDELRSIGLELPEITIILEKLNRGGYHLPAGILSFEEALDAILTALRKGEAI